MTLTEFKADDKGIIQTRNIVRILSFGVKDGVPRMWAITDALGGRGLPSGVFRCMKVGATIGEEDVMLYVSTLHEKGGDDWFVFGEKPKIDTSLPPNMPPPPGGLHL